MILFSFYFVVSTALLVQTFPREGNFGQGADPFFGLDGILPQSKDSSAKLKLSDVKEVLGKVLQGVVAPLKQQKRHALMLRSMKPCANHKDKASCKPKGEIEWDKWSDWSPCSVSCGRGRQIRWRNCLQNCDEVETEMQEKTCQLPACSGKLFGLINL